MDKTNLEMIKGLTEGSTSLLEIIKMQKELISLLEKRVSILETFVFRDVRKKEEPKPDLPKDVPFAGRWT